MPKKLCSRMTPSSRLAGEKSEVHLERRTRNGKNEYNTKKRFELDEDLNDIKVVPKCKKNNIISYLKDNGAVNLKSSMTDNNAKEQIDLSKYKDEYKHLIQSVKKEVPHSVSDTQLYTNKPSGSSVFEAKKKNKQTLNAVQSLSKDDSAKTPSSMDAFQIMMDARKKSIGMNSPGKELAQDEDLNDVTTQKELKAKRFLKLSMMADKKGASKRRELEELREENNKNALEKRAVTFKKMLQHNNKHKIKKTTPEKLKEGIKEYENIFVVNKSSKTFKKRRRESSSKCENDNVSVKKSKIQSKPGQQKNETTLVDSKTPVNKLNNSLLIEEDETFLKKLSPSLKKSESVLCYFGKSKTEQETNESSTQNRVIDDNEEQNQLIKVKFTPKTKNRKSSAHKKTPKSGKSKTIMHTNDTNDESTKTHILEINDVSTLKASNICSPEVAETTDIVSTPPKEHQRPRRSIRKPIKYMQESSEDSDSSDSSNENMFNLKKDNMKVKRKNIDKENVLTIEIDDKVSPLKIINLQSPGQLKCIKSPKTIRPCSLSDDSVAPLFRKKIPKPKVDPSVMEARRLFLQSGVPEVMKKHLEKSNSNISQDTNDFTTVHHIQQRSDDEENPVWNLPLTEYILSLSDLITDVSSMDINENNEKTVISKNNTIVSTISTVELFNKLNSYELKQGLRELKQTNLNFPVYKTFKQLWDKFISSPRSAKLSSQDSDGFVEDMTSDAHNVNTYMWTEKYKPLSSHDIIGNFTAISLIKRWLESWKEYNEMSASKAVKKMRRDSSSSLDFDLSDSESRDSCCKSLSNVMVITGPPGSGKTSSIYAISNELGINVLEVNASTRRTGKKILSDMHEATQSHKVMTKQNSELNFSGFFSRSETKDEPKLLSQTKKNNKKKSDHDSGILNSDSQKNPETNVMSLMLIDDADIVFEEDDGFVGALSQLVQSSKRPLLLVASDENCSHLQRFKSDSNVIKFTPLSGKILGPWLDTLLLIECNKIIPRLSANLLESNRGDMRKCILQLQYWISGSKSLRTDDVTSSPFCPEGYSDEESNSSWMRSDSSNNKITTSDVESLSKIKKSLLSELSSNCNLDRVWWNINSLLKGKFSNSSNACGDHVTESKSLKELENLYNYIDTYSTVDLMQSYGNNTNNGFIVPPWQRILKDSLSESENMTMYESHTEMSNAWCQYLQEHSTLYVQDILGDTACRDDITHIESLDIRAQERRLKIFDDFSQGVSFGSQLDRSSVVMDYMATLRCICRSEKSRSSCNMKRNNRFHNYLNTLNIPSNDTTINNACKIFVD